MYGEKRLYSYTGARHCSIQKVDKRIKKWIDHFNCENKKSKFMAENMKHVKKSSQTILVLNCARRGTATLLQYSGEAF